MSRHGILTSTVAVVLILVAVWFVMRATPTGLEPTVSATVTPLADAVVVLDAPLPGATVRSPLVLRGKARGTWYFEASFPVVLTDWDGRILAQVPAQAQGDWMTTDWVPFTATLTFDLPEPFVSSRAALILKKDNPSGDPARDDAREITVFLAE